jgi:hypothetical protein
LPKIRPILAIFILEPPFLNCLDPCLFKLNYRLYYDQNYMCFPANLADLIFVPTLKICCHFWTSTIKVRMFSLQACVDGTYILNIIIWQQSNSAIFNILYRIMNNSSLAGIWTHTIDTLHHHSLSLTSSALYHSTTSTP